MILKAVSAALAFFCLPAFAQKSLFNDLHVEKKHGKQTGAAIITAQERGKEKVKSISSQAFQAWPIMNAQNALVLALDPKNPSGQYRLRFVDGASRKRRDLGFLPFHSATLIEHKERDGSWTFVLSSTEAGRPEIVVANVDAIRGRLEHAAHPHVDGDRLAWEDSQTTKTQSAPFSKLLATDMVAIYQAHTPDGETAYGQFLPDGRAVLTSLDGRYQTGSWYTDGRNMYLQLPGRSPIVLARADLQPVNGVPAGTRLVVRLVAPLSSHTAKEGDSVSAVLISPASVNGRIFLPQGSEFGGFITKAHGVGWAIKHETAALSVDFLSVKAPDGNALPIHTRLQEVQNSQETVNNQGSLQGIRSTGTLGHSAESKIASLAAVDPVAYLFTTVSASSALGFAEPEILYPAGTELMIEIESPLITAKTFTPAVPPLSASQSEEEKLTRFVHALPFRTMTKGSNKPSDLTNLIFIGTPESVHRAFQAAGWVATDELTANSTFQTLKTLGGNQSYNQAPMSTLLLDERPPVFTLAKTTNTFSSRHHIRIFDPQANLEGTAVLTASSTQDIGIAFSSKQKTFIHVIDQHIDNERSKVVNDLEFTGCVEAAEVVPRPWTPRDAYNSTGDRLQTDGGVAVLRLSNCLNPRVTPRDNAVPPRRFERIFRDTMLTLRNDVWRGNVAYQGYSVSKAGYNYFAHKDELQPDTGAWQKTDVSGARFQGVGRTVPDQQPSARVRFEPSENPKPEPAVVAAEEAHRWDPPKFEIGLEGGYLFYPNIRVEGVGVLLLPKDLASGLPPLGAAFADEVDGGWSLGIRLTANTWKWFSNEFSYNYQRGKYRLVIADFSGLADDTLFGPRSVGLVTRQFDYNLLFHLRPPKSRWRPYVAAGPALQLMSLSDAPLKKAPAPFKLGLQNVGTLLAAFNFAGDPPLEGGGIFQLGLQYGAGIKFRVHPRVTLNADFRETWSKNPNFTTDTYTNDYFFNDFDGYNVTKDKLGASSAFRQDRATLGVAFSF